MSKNKQCCFSQTLGEEGVLKCYSEGNAEQEKEILFTKTWKVICLLYTFWHNYGVMEKGQSRFGLDPWKNLELDLMQDLGFWYLKWNPEPWIRCFGSLQSACGKFGSSE